MEKGFEGIHVIHVRVRILRDRKRVKLLKRGVGGATGYCNSRRPEGRRQSYWSALEKS